MGKCGVNQGEIAPPPMYTLCNASDILVRLDKWIHWHFAVIRPS